MDYEDIVQRGKAKEYLTLSPTSIQSSSQGSALS